VSRASRWLGIEVPDAFVQRKGGFMAWPVLEYTRALSASPDDVLDALAAETAALGPAAEMQIPPEQGALLTMLTALSGGTRAIEIGTFTGYSSICIARGLGPGGRLVCLDRDDAWTAVARKYWAAAGLTDRIELRLGPAAESLAALPEEPVFDLAFVDADKASYAAYYELLLPRIRPGGLIVVDNVFQYGQVLRDRPGSPDAVAMRAFNESLAADPRIELVVLPIADGVAIARRLP
jgi:caffeoyl-CoA O-methyltransferase